MRQKDMEGEGKKRQRMPFIKVFLSLSVTFRLFLLLSFLSIAIPSQAIAEPITVQFWYSMSGQKGKLLNSMIADFNALPENAGKVRVESQFIGSYEEGLNKLRTGLMAGRIPHVVQITDIGTQLMIDSGAMKPLQD